jgi:hypothetical protein
VYVFPQKEKEKRASLLKLVIGLAKPNLGNGKAVPVSELKKSMPVGMAGQNWGRLLVMIPSIGIWAITVMSRHNIGKSCNNV